MNKPDKSWPKGRNRKPSARPGSPGERQTEVLWLYGLHTVEAALANPRRQVRRLITTRNALARLEATGVEINLEAEMLSPRQIDHLVGFDAVHQGVAIEVAPLITLTLNEMAKYRLVVALDQVTDPHNTGAILRSALAFGADAVLTTMRHAAVESGVMAKAASGALDRLPLIRVTNLARALAEMGRMGFTLVGLDSEAEEPLEQALSGHRVVLVLGAEGKGLRKLTRETCDHLARLSVPGKLISLNVSNAAAVALYVAQQQMPAPD
jgi:23S rRNA (guanosine2251-2'-O)-methyltransferase